MRLLPIASVLILASVLTACGSDAKTKTVTETVTKTETVTPDDALPVDDECSASRLASDLELKLPDQDLPTAVAKTREELFDAAIACDFDALAAVGAHNADEFAFSYSAATDAAEYWRSNDSEQRTMERLARLLTTPFVEVRQGPLTYAWPSVHQDAPSADDYADLVASGAYTKAEADAFRRDGSYLGYRIGIKPDGAWSYFLAGD